MIRVAYLPGSVSRMAGGLYTSVRRLSESVEATAHQKGRVAFRTEVLGHLDAHTSEDLHAWRRPPQLIESSGLRERISETMRFLDRTNPEIVHPQFLWSYASIAVSRWVARESHRVHLVSPRGMLDAWALRHSRWKKCIAGWLFEWRHLKRARCIHALCESEAASIRQLGLRSPICVLPNGIDVPDFDPVEDIGGSEQIRPPEDGRKVLLFLGRLHEKKGLLPLLDAWARCRARLSDWVLMIAGWDDNGHEAQLRRKIDEERLHDSVRFAGGLVGSPKKHALMMASAFILPSFSEGLPMSVLEAWAYRLPVLMTDHCNLPQGFASGSAKRIGTTADHLSAGLEWLASSQQAELTEMGGRGRGLVEREFAWNRIAARMQGVYVWAIGGGPAPDCVILD